MIQLSDLPVKRTGRNSITCGKTGANIGAIVELTLWKSEEAGCFCIEKELFHPDTRELINVEHEPVEKFEWAVDAFERYCKAVNAIDFKKPVMEKQDFGARIAETADKLMRSEVVFESVGNGSNEAVISAQKQQSLVGETYIVQHIARVGQKELFANAFRDPVEAATQYESAIYVLKVMTGARV